MCGTDDVTYRNKCALHQALVCSPDNRKRSSDGRGGRGREQHKRLRIAYRGECVEDGKQKGSNYPEPSCTKYVM